MVDVATGAKHEIDISSTAPHRRKIKWANNNKLVFESSNDNNNYMELNIYVIDTASGAIKQIASGYNDPQPQPGSNKVLLTKSVKDDKYAPTSGYRNDLYVGHLLGSTPTLVAKHQYPPRWSPDGSKFVARTSQYSNTVVRGTVIRNLTSVKQAIPDTDQPNLGYYSYLRNNPWSFNGRYLLYPAMYNLRSNLYMYDTTKGVTQKPRQLTTNPDDKYNYTDAGFTKGGRVIYTRQLKSNSFGTNYLYSINLSTNTTTRIYGGGELRGFSL